MVNKTVSLVLEYGPYDERLAERLKWELAGGMPPELRQECGVVRIDAWIGPAGITNEHIWTRPVSVSVTFTEVHTAFRLIDTLDNVVETLAGSDPIKVKVE